MTALPVVAPGVPAPPWSTTEWIHSDPLDVGDLRGRVVVLEAFQMLCPGCVNHGLPQIKRGSTPSATTASTPTRARARSR